MYDIHGSLPDTTILFIFLISSVTIFFQIRYDASDLNYGPIILTMLGILGCFLGIAKGLFYFDTTNVQNSCRVCSTESRHPFGHRLPASSAHLPSRLVIKYLGPYAR